MVLKSEGTESDNKSSKIILASLLAVIIVIAVVYTFVHYVYETYDNVFYGMLNSSLSTSSYIKRVTQKGNNLVTGQTIYVQTSPNKFAISAEAQSDQKGNSKFETLNIGTLTTDYSKFVSVQTGDKDSNGNLINYTPLIGEWSKNVPSTNGKIFYDALLGSVVPIGKVTGAERASLISYIKKNDVYILGKMKKNTVDGSAAYTYSVGINLPKFAVMMNQFGTNIGLKLPKPNTSQLEHQLETVSISINPLTRRLININYPDSVSNEQYSNFNQRLTAVIPSKTVPVSTIENMIKKIGGN